MVVGEASIHNIMGGMESTGGVRLHNHKRKLKQRFDIIKKLGQGTYGKVQLGINKETGQEVAIKTIKKCKIDTEADLIRIRREIQIMSSVQHPNIIHIYEVFENREKMVLVMEYAAGGELYDYLSERKVLTEQEARRIFRQIATAVFYCHKHKICHRDLKLENILLDQVGNAKIADFGLSNVFDEQRLLSTFCGSPLYASPEIVKGTPYHGPAVDCWSLGVLLYTLVYGAMPFDGSNFKRLVKQISQSDYFEPKELSPASPLIKDMLTVCPARRADIERICAHWWVNEGYEQNCLDIAEDLAAQTPVRLDLLLSLVPQSASAEKLLVGDQQAGGDVASMSSEALMPTRCHSVGSLMELDQNSSDRRIRELLEEALLVSAAEDAKNKLETTPSINETAAAGVKRKERSRRKERTDEREPRAYRSTSRHHSAPIPNSITEEAMEVDPATTATVPTTKTADLNKIEVAAACLELIEESKEKSPSKERSRTPVASENEHIPKKVSTENVAEDYDMSVQRNKEETQEKYVKSLGKNIHDDVTKPSDSTKAVNKLTNEDNATKTEVPNKNDGTVGAESEGGTTYDVNKIESSDRSVKKLKEKALSLDSETLNETPEVPAKTVERRRSKIFETAEKFNQLASNSESDKPKKIFIPGVNVGGAKRVFERKASLSSLNTPPKTNTSKVIIDVPTDKKNEKVDEKTKANQEAADAQEKLKKEEAKKRAVDIITGAIGKPPVQRKLNGSPPISPQTQDSKKLGLKIQVGPNDIRSATVSVSTPVDTKFPFDNKSLAQEPTVSDTSSTLPSADGSQLEEPKMSSKMEITLKSATLPRPRKTSKAEITLSGIKSPETTAFKSEVEAKIDAFQPQKLRTQRSEVAFPVAAAVPQTNRSSSLEPEMRPKSGVPKERIIPIQVEPGHQGSQHASTPPPKPPMPQRSMSQRSASLSRQSTADSDTDSALGSTVGPEPIRKSPREYIIPIAVEGGGYVTPRSGSVEPESKTSTPTSTNAPRSRFGRPRRMSSFLSDASEDESPFTSLHRDSEDLLQRHMHRLRSSRPSRQPPEHADSLSSGEDDDDDGFELLTAENLFSTLLSRVRSLTQRLNVDDNRGSGFPSSRLFGRLGANSPQAFWGLNKPLSRRLSESQFKHSLSRDADVFATRKDSAGSTNPGSPNSPGSHSNPSRESVFEVGSNTLPRDKIEHEDVEAETAQIRKEAQESLEQNFTPSLVRRLNKKLNAQSISRKKYYQPPTRETLSMIDTSEASKRRTSSTNSDQTEYRGRSAERNIRRSNSPLEAGIKMDKLDHHIPAINISLYNNEDRFLPPLPKQVMTLGRKYKESGKSSLSNARKDNLYRTEKIQEEPFGEMINSYKENGGNIDNHIDNGSTSECTSLSVCNSTTNLVDTTSSVSAKSYETESPTESSSNIIDYSKSGYKCDASKNFESRLLAAENLIKESKLKNLGPAKFNPNLSTSYKDTDKCDKESLISISDTTNTSSKRRSCIPCLRLRSGSLSREPSVSNERRKSFANTQDALGIGSTTPERSILSKFFRAGSSSAKESGDLKEKERSQKPRQHRISRFLRPDFFDTPREESQYVKEKEAQKAAENERRKSRFMKKRNENKVQMENDGEAKVEKELKNEMNLLKKDSKSTDASSKDKLKKDNGCDVPKLKYERQNSKNSFLHSLEKKLEKFRSGEETTKPVSIANGGISTDETMRSLRETSAPPAECLCTESNLTKRAISVEDLSSNKAPSIATKTSRVSSVLGLFKSTDGKQSANGSKSQNVILSKLKKSPPKLTKEVSPTEEMPSTSKIPKSSKNDVKSGKRVLEGKSSPEKIVTDIRRPLIKEKSKEREINPREKKTVADKRTKETKKGTERPASETSSSNVEEKEKIKRLDSPTKTDDTKKLAEETEVVQKITDNKQLESVSRNEDKKLMKTKKNVSSLTKSNSVAKTEKSDEGDKKVKRVVKTKTGTEKDEGEGVKKKKIVRVVKKVVKKSSDSSDSRTDDKEKSGKSVIKKGTTLKKETSPDATVVNTVGKTKSKEANSEPQTVLKTTANHTETKALTKEADTVTNSKTEISNSEIESKPKSNTAVDAVPIKLDLPKSGNIKDIKLNPANENNIAGSPTESNTFQSKSIEQQRPDRSSLKLDLSKIPQHTFRNTTPKRDSPRSELPKEKAQESKINAAGSETTPEKVIESLSKMTHHANITGNKIVIDKPLRAKDVAELKKEVNECARIIENHIESHHEGSTPQAMPQTKSNAADTTVIEKPLGKQQSTVEHSDVNTLTKADSDSEKNYGESISVRNDAFSPMEEPESFDSWSICSADLNHTRGDLNSPTSPSYSLFSRDDQPESIIDRIRRRSFYSRFNDRKRPSLTAPPPGITLPTSTTLPRKYSLSSSRDRSRSKLSNYVTPRSTHTLERNYSLYNDDIPSYRKSPVEKERYSDIAMSYSGDRRSPIEHYSSSYDPLRKYLKSPSLDLSSSRRRYHSTDFSTDSELGSYRSPLSSSLLSDNPVESYVGKSSCTLPRKYGSSVSNAEPKSVEYYEELLAPSNPEYLMPKSPSSHEYLGRCENGYHNGNLDLPQFNADKRKSYANKLADMEFTERERELGEQKRSTSRQRVSETKDLPSTSSEAQSNACIAE